MVPLVEVKVQQVQVEQKNVDRESEVEEERYRKENPKTSAQFFFQQPRRRILPDGDAAAPVSLGWLGLKQLLH